MNNLKLGCDPEIFLVDAAGKFKSSIGLIGGSKSMPLELPIGEGYAVQEDNVAVEFNIPPASNAKEFVHHIGTTLKFLTDHVKQQYGFEFSKESATYFPKEELTDPAALMFGCDPDFNAWTMTRNPRPKADNETLRSCGGHVHIGCGRDVDGEKVIRCADLFLGVPSAKMDKGLLRKGLYGKHGAYRIKPYGVEYRVLSNFWIFSEQTIDWVWRNTAKAVEAAEAQLPIEEDYEQIKAAIDNNDLAAADYLINKWNLEVLNV